jgi:hypothetical protein
MHPNDRDPAFGIIVGVVCGVILGAAAIHLIAAYGEPVLRSAVWHVVVLAEAAR